MGSTSTYRFAAVKLNAGVKVDVKVYVWALARGSLVALQAPAGRSIATREPSPCQGAAAPPNRRLPWFSRFRYPVLRPRFGTPPPRRPPAAPSARRRLRAPGEHLARHLPRLPALPRTHRRPALITRPRPPPPLSPPTRSRVSLPALDHSPSTGTPCVCTPGPATHMTGGRKILPGKSSAPAAREISWMRWCSCGSLCARSPGSARAEPASRWWWRGSWRFRAGRATPSRGTSSSPPPGSQT